jgi:hypothetical protein
MTCPKVDRICRDCRWDKPNSYNYGSLDKCSNPKVFYNEGEYKEIPESCYVSGKSGRKCKQSKLSEYCRSLRVGLDYGYHVPGVDICGKEGLWFEPKPAKKWWQIWR